MSGTESRANPDAALARPEGGGVQMTEYPTTQTPETTGDEDGLVANPLFFADRKNALLEAEVEQLTTLLSQAAVRAAEWEEAAKGYKASLAVRNEELKGWWALANEMARDGALGPEWRRALRIKLGMAA